MNSTKITFETLNSYVDGELNAADTAEVAAAIAHDPHLARQVAVLTKLHSSIIETAETPEIEQLHAPAKRSRTGPGLLAAGIAFLIFISGAVLISSSFDRPVLPQWYEVTANALERWPDRPSEKAPVMEITEPAGSFAEAYVPDLLAAKLFINHVEEKTVSVLGSLRVIGYRGTRGCRIVLTIFADGGSFPVGRTFLQDGNIQAYAWRAGRLGYAMIADGMDAERFNLVVKTVHETTLRRLPLDAKTRVALGESRQRSVPCLA
tara:strand:- start:1318 stop:2106 length:789 start_codon:yes stop_codon:yes gene_type:complete